MRNWQQPPHLRHVLPANDEGQGALCVCCQLISCLEEELEPLALLRSRLVEQDRHIELPCRPDHTACLEPYRPQY